MWVEVWLGDRPASAAAVGMSGIGHGARNRAIIVH